MRPSGTIAIPAAMISSAGSAPMSRPSNRTMSGACIMTPAMDRMSVVFPAPFAPMTASVSPSARARSTPKSAWKSP